MLLTSSLRTAIAMAADVAAAAFQVLPKSDWPPTLYELHESGRRWEEKLDSGADDFEQRKQVWLQTNMAGTVVKLMAESRATFMPDSACALTLLIEFSVVPEVLHGLVLALPYSRSEQGPGLLAGMVQVYRYPEAIFPMLDEILPEFTALLSSRCDTHWRKPMEYDRKLKPSQASYESESPVIAARCPSFLSLPEPGWNSNEIGSRYLDALIARYPFDDGICFQRALYQLKLDFSLPSLLRVDYLLGELQNSLSMTEDEFTARTANMNFLYCVAFYCSKVIAKAAGCHVDWYSTAQFGQRFPEKKSITASPARSLVAVFNATGGEMGMPFFPLQAILRRLFAKETSQQLRSAFKQWGKAAFTQRAASINDEMPAVQQLIDNWPMHQREYLTTKRIDWFKDKYFNLWFQTYFSLYRGGRVVWACIVQAHNQAYTDENVDRFAQIVFDPQGLLTPPQLEVIAKKLNSYKGCRPFDARLGFMADFMTDEIPMTLGAELPYRISSDDVCTSAILLIRKHLPVNRLLSNYLPVLIHDAFPGVALFLPSKFWTPAIARQCAAYGWPVH
ncbi:hypothetical protein ACO0LD_17590 [Undibacterium sp. Ji83W]|uniref:hypothetical protein n=1 Tax=Undibacterium sp. Ji83W TaxID=3413043 RepID=UPI003BF287F0